MTDPTASLGDGLAVDPGLNKPGASLWRGGHLIASQRVLIDREWKSLDVGERANRVARSIVSWALAHRAKPRWLAYERPRIYGKDKSRADPEDIIGIALVAAAVGGQLWAAMAELQISLVISTAQPAEIWGQCPKGKTDREAWTAPRGLRVASRLDPVERAACQDTLDAVDACGVGLWKVGRYERRRSFFGAVDG